MADNCTALSGLILSGIEPTGEDLGKAVMVLHIKWCGMVLYVL